MIVIDPWRVYGLLKRMNDNFFKASAVVLLERLVTQRPYKRWESPLNTLFNRAAVGVRGLWFAFGLLTAQP